MWCVKPRVLIGKLVLACANMLCSTAEHAILAHSSAGFDRLVCYRYTIAHSVLIWHTSFTQIAHQFFSVYNPS